MKVLVAVDGSVGSKEAVRQIGLLIAAGRDQVCLYYSPPAVKFPAGATPSSEVQAQWRTKLTDAVFDDATQLLPVAARSSVQRIIGSHAPKEGILAAADECGADLIAVGARGVGLIADLLLGSVSNHVVRNAAVPVLVARAASGAPAMNKILVACAGEGHASLAQAVSQLSFPASSTGKLMRVIEPMFAGQLPEWLETMARDADTEPMAQAWVREHDEEKKRTAASLSAARASYPPAFASAEPIVAEGYSADQVLKVAAQEGAQLLVMGARRLSAMTRLILGSTSENVLQHAACSVLIVRERPQP
jgi:nucleotide-binding universal stress UspA family protein